MSAHFVYLASGSPRRRELLTQIGVQFQVIAVDVDESAKPGELPEVYVERLSRAKAEAGHHVRSSESTPVLAADTAVILDGRILGKPVDAEDGARMLRELSGRTHEVLTGIALRTPRGARSTVSRSQVTFRAVGDAEAREYWTTGEPCDKAGGYAIQGRGAVFIADLKGSFSGVMGLPLFETAALLDAESIPRWR